MRLCLVPTEHAQRLTVAPTLSGRVAPSRAIRRSLYVFANLSMPLSAVVFHAASSCIAQPNSVRKRPDTNAVTDAGMQSNWHSSSREAVFFFFCIRSVPYYVAWTRGGLFILPTSSHSLRHVAMLPVKTVEKKTWLSDSIRSLAAVGLYAWRLF